MGRASGFVEVNRGNKCRTCGRSSWCSYTSDGRAWICRRVQDEGAQERRDKHGQPYWLYGAASARPPVRPPDPQPAPARILHRVYGWVLSQLELAPDHRTMLEQRGLPEFAIVRCRTWDPTRLPDLARRAAREWPDQVASVPGWFKRPGWACPVRGVALPSWNQLGQVVGLQIRLDTPLEGCRYRVLSSKPLGGPGPVTVASLALPPAFREQLQGRCLTSVRAEQVRITEGFFKAWVAAERTGTLTIDARSCSSWELAVPYLRMVRAREVLLAFDADFRENENVRRSLVRAVQSLSCSYRVLVETWDPVRGKGIDDVLREVA